MYQKTNKHSKNISPSFVRPRSILSAQIRHRSAVRDLRHWFPNRYYHGLCVSDLTKTDLLLFNCQTVLCGLPSKFMSEKKSRIKNINICRVQRCIYQKPESTSPNFFLLGPRARSEKKKKTQKDERIAPFTVSFSHLHYNITQHV